MILQEEKVEIVELKNVKETTITKNHLFIYIIIFIAILFAFLITIFGGFTFYNLKNSDVITSGIYIYGVNVSGLTKKEAKEKLVPTFNELSSHDISLKSEGYETFINPTEIDLKYDINSAINYAFNIGKSGDVLADNYEIFDKLINGIDITPTFSINDEKLYKYLDGLSKELPNAVVQSSYYIEKSNLVITKGKDGFIVNAEESLNNVKQNISNFNYLSSSIELSLTPKSPSKIDIEKIYKEIHKDAKDAHFTTNPYAVYPSETGVDFKISMAEAKELINNSNLECEIPLKTVYPKITTNMIGKEAFPDLLSTFSTNYVASNVNRTTNLKLAAQKINGTVLMPGDEFSYNGVVGERTIAAGYKDAAIYSNGQVVDGLGGGICQISTTLFNAILYSNLKVTEIHNHQFVPSYAGAGRDATVVYGIKDFKFKNSRNYAIKIECSVSGGVARFNIYGMKEKNEPNITINAKIISRTSSYIKASTSRTLSRNGQIILAEHIYNSTYKTH